MVNLQEHKTSNFPSLDRAMSGLINEIEKRKSHSTKGGRP